MNTITITRKDGAYIVTIDGGSIECSTEAELMSRVGAEMSDHALVGGLVLAIGFLLFWFGEECERQMRKERGR